MADNEKKDKEAQEAIQEEMAHAARGKSRWEDLWKKEDWWANWLGGLLLLFGLIVFWAALPAEAPQDLEEYEAVIEREEARAPFATIEQIRAQDAMDAIRARDHGLGPLLGDLIRRPRGWDDNPVDAFYLSEARAAEMREQARPRYEEAQQETQEALAVAEEAQAAAEEAGFVDENLNQEAVQAIDAWLDARAAEASARRAATVSSFNLVPSLILLMVGLGLFFSIGIYFMGGNVGKFLVGFPIVFIISIIGFFIGNHAIASEYGLSYVLWCIIIGLLISNTISTPGFVKPSVQTEYYIKTGLVLLGGSILFGLILMIGAPGIVVAWGVTPTVLIIGYWVGNKYIKLPSKPLNVCVAAAASVCGVSAAIAAAAASKAKGEELTIAVGLSLVFTALFMFLIPAFVVAVGMNPILGGAWIGGTVDSTGAVVAAGELLGPGAMYTAATLKMIQNVMIGILAFAIAAYWAIKVEREAAPDIELTVGAALKEIWTRFPKFVIGFIVASVVFTIIYEVMGRDIGDTIISDGVLGGWANPLRAWFFAMAFTSIGLATNFRELAKYFAGGKILYHYVFTQGFNLILTLVLAWLMFMVVFPGITEHLMEIR